MTHDRERAVVHQTYLQQPREWLRNGAVAPLQLWLLSAQGSIRVWTSSCLRGARRATEVRDYEGQRKVHHAPDRRLEIHYGLRITHRMAYIGPILREFQIIQYMAILREFQIHPKYALSSSGQPLEAPWGPMGGCGAPMGPHGGLWGPHGAQCSNIGNT